MLSADSSVSLTRWLCVQAEAWPQPSGPLCARPLLQYHLHCYYRKNFLVFLFFPDNVCFTMTPDADHKPQTDLWPITSTAVRRLRSCLSIKFGVCFFFFFFIKDKLVDFQLLIYFTRIIAQDLRTVSHLLGGPVHAVSTWGAIVPLHLVRLTSIMCDFCVIPFCICILGNFLRSENILYAHMVAGLKYCIIQIGWEWRGNRLSPVNVYSSLHFIENKSNFCSLPNYQFLCLPFHCAGQKCSLHLNCEKQCGPLTGSSQVIAT